MGIVWEIDDDPRSTRCETCYIMPYRKYNNSANTKLSCYSVARLRNYVFQRKRIPFAHPNALPRLSTERLRTNLLQIIARTESQDTATDMSQMNKTLRPLRVAITRRPHLIETILC